MLFLVLGMSQQQQVGALPGVFWSKVLVSAATKELEVELELKKNSYVTRYVCQ